MSVNAMKWAWDQTTGDKTAKSVLLSLADWSSDHGHGQELCWHAQETIAERVECDRRTAMRALEYLEFNGFIRREKRSRKDGTGRSSDIIYLCMERDPSAKLKSKSDIQKEKTLAKGQNVTKGAKCQNVTLPPVKMSLNPLSECHTNLKDLTSKKEPNMPKTSFGELDCAKKVSDRPERVKSEVEQPTPSGQSKTKPKKDAGPSFDEFWQQYPNKRGKQRAVKRWNTMTAKDRVAAIAAIPLYLAEDECTKGYIQHGGTFLCSATWKDYEVTPEEQTEKQVKSLAADLSKQAHGELEPGQLQLSKRFFKDFKSIPSEILRQAQSMCDGWMNGNAYA